MISLKSAWPLIAEPVRRVEVSVWASKILGIDRQPVMVSL